MNCPKCQLDNREGIKFCEECGAKMEFDCPHCGMKIPLGKKFCGECGHPLSLPVKPIPKELSSGEKLQKIQRYLPGGLTERILSQRGRIEGERRQTTVMFADMAGFTPLVEKLGPEEAYAIMDRVYEILIHKVHDYEGTVNEMTGDGIMALFGAPIALEDAPQRAIRSAHAIHREITRFSERIKQEKGMSPIRMRIGIHTGPVVVGTLGNDLRVEFKAVGDTVNLASRMEGLAEPGTTLVTEDTFKLAEGFFRFEALGEKYVKGKEGQVKVYQVIAPSSRRTRFDVSAERGLTPFVGRERDLELLLDSLGRAKEGRGEALSIIGEAGVGKSRFLYEFRKAVASEYITFLEGKCLSYGRGVAYHPIIDILKANFEIREGEDDFGVREKVTKGLKTLKADTSSTLPFLLELLSVKDSGMDRISLSREARKDRILEALKQIVLKGSEIRPLVIAVEDLHWVDKSSEDTLKYLLENIPGARVLLIFTYRPEFVHTWAGRSYHSQITLNRLSNRESLAMVAHLLGAHEIERDLEELILKKTEGIPFFIEEFINSLKNLKIIEKKDRKYQFAKDIHTATLPSTIQDVIMARVDSLPQDAKELLQTGSVIEREFGHELIKKVTGLPEKQLLSHLSLLKASELLYERGIYPESAYVFRHALTREVVYDSILARKKKELHEEIGKGIEEIYSDNQSEYYESLAEHFIASENYGKAAEYSRLAGKKAEKTGSLNDAIAHAKKRIASLERLPQTNDVQKKRIDTGTNLGLYLMQLSNFVSAKEAIDPIVDVALQTGYKRRLSQIYSILGAYHLYVEESFPDAVKKLEEALKISQDMNDNVSLFFANYWLGIALSHNCEFERAGNYLEKALAINIAAKSLWGISLVQACLSLWVYHYQGRIDLAYETSLAALHVADESGDTYSRGSAHNTFGISCFLRGLWKDVEEHSCKAADLSESINFVHSNVGTHFNLGETYFEMGEYEKSKDHYGRAITILERSRIHPSWMNLSKMGLAKAKVLLHEKDIDVKKSIGYAEENKVKLFDGRMARYIAEILLHMDDQHMNEAERWIQKAVETDNRNGMMWYAGRDFALWADLFERKGDRWKAKEHLTRAIEIFRKCGADGWVSKYEKELASIP